MLNIEIDGKAYKAFHSWGEMPLSFAIELFTEIKANLPKKLEEFYNIVATSTNDEALKERVAEWTEALSEEERIKTLPRFYGLVIQKMFAIPAEVMDQIQYAYRTSFYSKYCDSFVFGLLYVPMDFVEKKIKSFEHEGVEYFLPEGKEVFGKDKPMAFNTVFEFSEAADLELFSKDLAGGKHERAANIISILCRPKDKSGKIEKYDEDVSLKRAESFKSLNMDIVWEVFFCLAEQSSMRIQYSTLKRLETALSQPQPEKQAV